MTMSIFYNFLMIFFKSCFYFYFQIRYFVASILPFHYFNSLSRLCHSSSIKASGKHTHTHTHTHTHKLTPTSETGKTHKTTSTKITRSMLATDIFTFKKTYPSIKNKKTDSLKKTSHPGIKQKQKHPKKYNLDHQIQNCQSCSYRHI